MAAELLSAFLVGLLGGVHCVGMCGGIVGALTFGLPEPARQGLIKVIPYQLAYNLGRILSYVLAGAIMGGLGMLLAGLMPVYYAQQGLLAMAGLFMVLLGLYLGGWWFGLTRLEKMGAGLWRRVEPLAHRLLPVRSLGQAMILGLLWGWIPCGLVYSMLIWSASAGSAVNGGLLMLVFALGTLPNLLAMGVMAGGLATLLRRPGVARVAGGTVTLLGIFTLGRVIFGY